VCALDWPATARAHAFSAHEAQRTGRITPHGGQPLIAEDGATGKQLEFGAPPGYPRTILIWLTQWLDDDTVVFASTLAHGEDLLECQVATGACEVVLTGPKSLVLPEIG